MENISQLLAQSESSQEDSDCESVVMGILKSVSSSSKSLRTSRDSEIYTDHDTLKQHGRQPTRKPDPTVYNRNALLARENRRRKKAHLETIEKELDDARNTNRLLLKALKKQMKTTQRLEQERSYFKNILANRTEIVKLMSAINSQMRNRQPSLISRYSSSSSEDFAAMRTSCVSTSSSSTADQGSVANIQNSDSFLDGVSNYLDEFFTDLQPLTNAVGDSWNELLQDDEFGLNNACISPHSSEGNASTEYQVVDEHSYVNMVNADNEDNSSLNNTDNIDSGDSGVCLHITRGKVSLEFCPSCHWKAGNTPPTQLLQNELDTII